MHPRNIFKDQVNYGELAKKYPPLQEYVQKKKTEGWMIDFKNDDAVRVLNRCLLLEFLGLHIDIPKDCLIPRIPLRLNYLLWIEDLVHDHLGKNQSKTESNNVRGLDIGTGPCAIYAIIGAKRFGWNMTGTDISKTSIETAVINIEKNSLNEKVAVLMASSESFFDKLSDTADFDFSMCNPPFFSDTDDMLLRSEAPVFWTQKSSLDDEIMCQGGEVSFILRMFKESKQFSRCKIFTSMVGVKSHLEVITKALKALKFNNFTTTTFTQGKNCRWGLAWSWHHSIDLRNTSKPKASKNSSKPYSCDFPAFNNHETFTKAVKTLLQQIEISLDETENHIVATAFHNTWSHNRRKRRHESRAIPAESEDESRPSIKVKVCEAEGSAAEGTMTAVHAPNEKTVPQAEEGTLALQFRMTVALVNKIPRLTMEYIAGTLGRDGVHQILQYLKNHVKPG